MNGPKGAKVGRSATWYSESGDWMTHVNDALKARPLSGVVDDWGRHDLDDDWERIWLAAPEEWDREII